MHNGQAKKKLWGSKVDEIGFQLVIPVHVNIVRMKWQEGEGIKSREGSQ